MNSFELPGGGMRSNKGAEVEWIMGFKKEELVTKVMSGLNFASVEKRNSMANILEEIEREMKTAGEAEEDIEDALRFKLRQLGAK